jgi:dCTP deaminase
MILTGPEIARELQRGGVVIDPFEPGQLNPNSYNYRLGTLLKVPLTRIQDPSVPGRWRTIRIPRDGYVLKPNVVHLGHTFERIGSSSFVASLIGRSSLGRLGLFLQLSADLAQLGLVHRWTLEMVAVQPIRVYPYMRIGQVSFWAPQGGVTRYDGNYVGTDLPTPSRPWKIGVVADGGGVKPGAGGEP